MIAMNTIHWKLSLGEIRTHVPFCPIIPTNYFIIKATGTIDFAKAQIHFIIDLYNISRSYQHHFYAKIVLIAYYYF